MLEVKVLGTGCAKCQKLYDEVAAVIAAAGLQAQLEKIEKIDEIVEYGIMLTPGLVIAGEVKSVGKVPGRDQLAKWLNEAG